MKHLILSCLSCLLCGQLYAQVIKPDQMRIPSSNIGDKLVELAIQNPEIEIADHQINIAKYQLKQAKGWWFDNVSLSFNANDFTIKRLGGKTLPNGQLYPIYPLYNLGLNIPIGGIFSKPAATKAAKEQVAIAQAERVGKYRQVRAQVLSAYEDYLSNQELLTVQSQITESSYNDFLQAKEKFRNGQISVNDYNDAAKAYHDQILSRISAEHNLNLTKIQLEALIGVPLSSIIKENGSGNSSIPAGTTQPVIDSTGTN